MQDNVIAFLKSLAEGRVRDAPGWGLCGDLMPTLRSGLLLDAREPTICSCRGCSSAPHAGGRG